MNNRHHSVRFSLMQSFYWCSVGAFASFALMFFQEQRGVSASQVGLLTGVFTLCAFCGQFFWGYLCDTWRTNKKVFILTCMLQCIIGAILYLSKGFASILILYGMLGFVQSPMTAILDTWIMKSFPRSPLALSPIRAAGSLSYAVLMLFYGKMIGTWGYIIMPVSLLMFASASVVTAYPVPDALATHEDSRHNKNVGGKLFTPTFLLLITCIFCCGVAGTTYTLYPIIITNVGGNTSDLGLALSVSAFSQVPFMILVGRISRIPAKIRLIASAVGYVVTLMCFVFSKTPVQIILASLISGISFGVMQPSMREIVYQHSPQQLRTTAQSISDAVHYSLSGLFASFAVGFAWERFGSAVVLSLFACVQFLGIILLMLLRKDT